MKNTQLAKSEQPGSIAMNGVVHQPKRLEEFTERLHDKPLQKDILTNKHADNTQYVPISVVEMKLDELFFGLWQVRNFRWQVVANEIVGSLELGVFHPVAKTWIWREGAGAVMIQQISTKRGGSGDITDIGQKIKNTLVKDFPHLKASCLTNAAKSLGAIFGRDLNRGYWDEYTPFSEKVEAAKHDDFIAALDNVKTDVDLNTLWKDNPQWHENEIVIDAMLNKKRELNPKKGKK